MPQDEAELQAVAIKVESNRKRINLLELKVENQKQKNTCYKVENAQLEHLVHQLELKLKAD